MSVHHDEHHLRNILNGFTGAEMEYLCEDEMVSIVPTFSQDPIPLLGTITPIGPFRPPMPTEVPLWMAIALKKQRKATIELPEWMRLERLTEWRDAEKRETLFVRPPVHTYIELARVLMHYARDDMERGSNGIPSKDLEERLGDIQDIRQAKIKKGLELIGANTPFTKLNNMSSMELNTIRTFYSTALSKFQRLHAATEDSAGGASQQQQSGAHGDGDVQMRGPQGEVTASQRRHLRAALPQPSQMQSTQAQSLPPPPETQPEQARKIRRTG